MTTARSNRFK